MSTLKNANKPLLCLLVFVFPVQAHSPLKATIPAANEVLAEAPQIIKLIFTKAARVTKVTLTYTNAGTSQTERLELPSKKFVSEMMLSHAFQGAGAYKVNWRALSEDGHAIKGSFSFTVTE